MGKIDADMRRIIGSSSLGYVATVSQEGRPNLSPKGSLAVWDDDHLFFADIASPGTIENLRHNPHVEVNFVDVIGRRGYRFAGTGEVLEDGPVFERAAEKLRVDQGPQYPCHRAVLITVEAVRPLLSPAYVFNDPAPSEDAVRALWMERLGVRPLTEEPVR